MVLDNKIIIFWWSCDQFLQDHQNKWFPWLWSRIFHDLVILILTISWSTSQKHPFTEIPWSGDLTPEILWSGDLTQRNTTPWSGDFTHKNQNSMIRWFLHLIFVIRLVYKSAPKVHWISTYASMIFCIVIINRKSLFPLVIRNFRFSTFGVPNKPLM